MADCRLHAMSSPRGQNNTIPNEIALKHHNHFAKRTNNLIVATTISETVFLRIKNYPLFSMQSSTRRISFAFYSSDTSRCTMQRIGFDSQSETQHVDSINIQSLGVNKIQ